MNRRQVLVLLLVLSLAACGANNGKRKMRATTTRPISAQVPQHNSSSTSPARARQSPRDDLPTPPPLPTAIPIPTFPPADLPTAGREPPRRLDPEITPLGIKIESPQLAAGERYWRVVAIQWHDPKEAAGRHYVWVRTRDKHGSPTAGQPVIFKWPSGQSSGPAPVDFPMYAAGHPYAIWIDDGIPSEKVAGMGLGTPSSRYTTDHVEYFVTFQVAVRGAPRPAS